MHYIDSIDTWLMLETDEGEEEIECEARLTSYVPADPGYITGPPEDCYPPSGAELEWELWVDGKRAIWLEEKLTEADIERIDEEFLDRAD